MIGVAIATPLGESVRDEPKGVPFKSKLGSRPLNEISSLQPARTKLATASGSRNTFLAERRMKAIPVGSILVFLCSSSVALHELIIDTCSPIPEGSQMVEGLTPGKSESVLSPRSVLVQNPELDRKQIRDRPGDYRRKSFLGNKNFYT
jgi:hypothetical protein